MTINELVAESHERAVKAGWYSDRKTGERIERNIPEMIALIHSELSEALEGHRKSLMDDHLPNRSMTEVELADVLIRVGDLAGYLGAWNMEAVVKEKMEYNLHREDHKLENRKKAY